MAISYNTGVAAATGSAASTFPLTIPAGVLPGDVMILMAYGGFCNPFVSDLTVASTGTAFTQIGTNQVVPGFFTFETAIYYAVAGSGDPGATVTATFTNSGEWAMGLASYTGASHAAPIDVHGGTGTGGSPASITCPSLTTVAANDWALQMMAGARGSSNAVNEPAGTTQRVLGTASSGAYAAIVDGNAAVPSGTGIGGGVFAMSTGTASTLFAFTIGLAPPAAAGSGGGGDGGIVAALIATGVL